MLKNYFKTAWRSLSRQKAYSLINVLGLTLGIACSIVIFLVVQYELAYDRFHTKADRIYRVTLNAIDFNPSVSMAIAPKIRNDFPELKAVTQVWFHQSAVMTLGDTKYEEKNLALVDQYFTSVFDYKWLEGNAKTALNEPNTIVLTETMAHKYFGDKEAMGKVVRLDDKLDLKVTGVIEDVPGNTHLPFNFLVSFETVRKDMEKRGAMSEFYWINNGAFTYIVLPENYPVKNVQSRIHSFVEKNWSKQLADEARLPLQPLTDIHFDQRYLNNTISYTTSRETYYALIAVAVLIIIVACINFINLATAQAIRRAKEVGVRKVLGVRRSQLIFQFLGETTIMVFAALLLALLVTCLFLPQLSKWLDIKIYFGQLATLQTISLILAGTVAIIVLAGCYPAFVQSAFKPALSLKNKADISSGKLTLRKSLVAMQFAISQVMIVGTLVVAYQMDFFQNRDLGFNKDAVISLGIPDAKKAATLKQELLRNPGVKALSFSSGGPVYGNFFCPFRSPELGVAKDDVTEMKFIDETYTDMFQLKMLAGEKIVRTAATEKDTTYNVVVNEAMIHKLGIQNPRDAIGKPVILNGNWYCTIQGVVQDFQSESKHKKIRPCALLYREDVFFNASVKIYPANMDKTLAAINKTWSGLFPDKVFKYEFLDDHIAAWYRQEQKEYTAFKMFAGIAIVIGCLGLYGLVAFAAAQRTKEVGVRKVLGASLTDIVFLFSKEFIWLIAIAFLIAAPIAYYVMSNWLQGFAYHINIGAEIFVIAILSSIVIAACTIAYQAIKAAVANPVMALRSE
ncbi:ABC transporter permease [Danxiaibacter flavus]|uniref:ABC transporter permease n=1 Tax=Danxiaibacter flavus TaxID=3049108 RepID=A0ABV3Z9I3_9BACT|nr:ABC transporter permease [Chitinophagaceae bacterium DXS]